MQSDHYESDRLLSEYVLFHYGEGADMLPYADGPVRAVGFPARCVTECVDRSRVPASARALDLGCAVGRSSFELARFCAEVIAVDYSNRFIAAAAQMKRDGTLTCDMAEEGDLTTPLTVSSPPGIDRSRVSFETGDAHDLRDHLGQFDVVLMANLIDRMHNPRELLRRLPGLLNPRGQLIITSPYTWLEQFTPRENWLGGFRRGDSTVRTRDTLTSLLTADFEFTGARDLPFLIREHARKFQWSVAEATMWTRR